MRVVVRYSGGYLGAPGVYPSECTRATFAQQRSYDAAVLYLVERNDRAAFREEKGTNNKKNQAFSAAFGTFFDDFLLLKKKRKNNSFSC